MELNDLKSVWQNAGGRLKSEEDLEKMTKIMNHPVIKRVKTKLVIQIVLLLFFLVVYYDWFDGDKKPAYANGALVTGLFLYILNDIIGYFSLVKPVGEANLKRSARAYLIRVKRLSLFSILVTLLYSSLIIIFFTSTIHFTKEKALILMFGIIVMVQLITFSYKLWSQWIKKLNQQIRDFNISDNGPVEK